MDCNVRANEFTNDKLAWRIRFKRFRDLDPLFPVRENKVYLMPFDFNALLTYSSLTGKDFDKIKNMPTEVYRVSNDALVGDMGIINKIFAKKDVSSPSNVGKTDAEILKELLDLKKQYLNTMVPFGQYRQGMFKRPEILAEPNQIEKINMSVYYDTDTNEIKAKQK